MKSPEQLKQSVAELQLLLDAANHERTRLENELIQEKEKSSEIQRLNAEVVTFYHYEIRTTVNAMLAVSELLENQDLGVEKQQHFIKCIQTGCRKLVKDLDEIREFSSKVQAPNARCQTPNVKRQTPNVKRQI